MFPLPASSIIFRAPSEEAGRKWMEAIELSFRYSNLIIPKHGGRDSVPSTPLSVNGNTAPGALLQAMNSIDRSDEDLLSSQHRENREIFNDSEIEKHFGM